MRRFGAVLAAIALVALAFVVRGAVTGDDGGADGGALDGDVPAGLACPVEFAAICTEVADDAIADATAGSTADELIAATSVDALGGEAWIVPRSWAELVVDERDRLRRAPLFAVDDVPVATTSVLIAVWADRHDQLAPTCGDVDWRCLADLDGTALRGGDRVSAGMPPIDSATGLPIAAAQAAALLGRPDFAANDFDSAFRSLAERLAAHQGDDPLSRMRTRGPGELTAAGVVAADATVLTSTFGTIRPLTAPAVRVDVVALVPSGRHLDASLRQHLATAFQAAGWSAAPTDGADDGLPPGGVLAAVRTVWNS